MHKQGRDFSLWDKWLFEISEVEITGVDCNSNSNRVLLITISSGINKMDLFVWLMIHGYCNVTQYNFNINPQRAYGVYITSH